jgi:hypothetical protein
MKNYQYKILGEWTGEEVSAERIRELVTNGSLTPYDFIKVQVTENGEKKWKKFMIRKHADEEFSMEEEFKEIEQDRAKLHSIRAKLDQLWKAQRDSLLAKITGTNPEKALDITRGDKIEFLPIHKKANEKQQVHRFVKDIEESCLIYWREAEDLFETPDNNEPEGGLQKAIKSGLQADCLNNPEKYCIDGLEGDAELDDVAYVEKRKKVEDWLHSKEFHSQWGAYIFYENDEPLYVGETGLRKSKDRKWKNGTYGKRFLEGDSAHFPSRKPSIKDKEWSFNCTKIRILLLNTYGKKGDSVKKEKSQAMERLLILKYDLAKLQNTKPGTKQSPLDDILSKLESEITGLCHDGELVEKGKKSEKQKAKLKGEKTKLENKIKKLTNELPSEPVKNDQPEQEEQ